MAKKTILEIILYTRTIHDTITEIQGERPEIRAMIDAGATFDEVLEESRKLMREGIFQKSVTWYVPQVSLTFEPGFYHGWGLHMLISRDKISIAPYGRAESTLAPMDAVMILQSQPALLARTGLEFGLLATRHALYPDIDHEQQQAAMTTLQDRLQGQAAIPYSTKDTSKKYTS